MERDQWLEVSQAINYVARTWKESKHYRHPTALIVRVYLWAATHEHSINWASSKANWPHPYGPAERPDQSTMSRRSRQPDTWEFMKAVGKKLSGASQGLIQLRCIDGKPLVVAAHSKDRDATFGRGAGQRSRGYKLHAIWAEGAMPEAWCVAPLNIVEKHMARRMLKRLEGVGYLLGDGHFDASNLHDLAIEARHQLVAPRQHPGSGLGHHYQSPHRVRALERLETPFQMNRFGTQLFSKRRQIERAFGNLATFGGGLSNLPAWVRRPWRVRLWVHAKLLLNAARICCLQRRKKSPDA